jgi:outer membrane protein assembly factor BamB
LTAGADHPDDPGTDLVTKRRDQAREAERVGDLTGDRGSRLRRGLGWLPALLLVPSAVVAGVAVTTPGDELADMREQQPLDLGTTWIYDVFDHGEPSGTRTSQVVGSASLLGRGEEVTLVPAAEVRRTYTDYPGIGPRTFVGYLAVEGRTLWQYAQEEQGTWFEIEPPLPAYRLPTEEGREWSYEGTVGDNELEFTTELVESEDVEVSGRTFTECMHAVTTSPEEVEGEPDAVRVIDEWTCDGIGTVRTRDRVEATGVDITEELTAFHGVAEDWESDPGSGGDPTDPVAGTTEGFDLARSFAVPDGELGRDPAWTDLRPERALLPPVSDGEVMVLAERNGAVSLRTTGTGEMRWRVQLRGPLLATPALAGDVVVVGDSLKRVWALSLDDGTARWVHELPDLVSAAPAVLGGTVVVPSDDGSVTSLVVADGHVAWTTGLDGAARTPPAYDGESLYVADLSGTLSAIDPEDGSTIWSDTSVSGLAQGPVLADGRVLVQDQDGIVHAYDPDGSVVWQSRSRGVGSEAMSAGNGVVVTTNAAEQVAAFAADDGHRLWRRDIDKVDSTPIIVGEEVLVATRTGDVHVLDLRTGQEVDSWKVPEAEEGTEFFNDVSAALVGDSVVLSAFAGGDLVHTMLVAYPVGPGAGTGLVPRLAGRRSPGTPNEPPVLSGDDMVVPTGSELVRVGPDGATLSLLESPGTLQTGAALADGLVAARSRKKLQVRDLRDGSLLWERTSGETGFGTTPAIGGSRVVASSAEGSLEAYDLLSGRPAWSTPIPTQLFVTAPLVLPDGDVVYGGGGVARYDGATGRQVWQDPTLHMVAAPAYADDVVLAAGIDPTGGPARFVALDAGTGAVQWEHEMTDPPFYLAPGVGDGVVVSLDDRVATAYDVHTGERLWSLTMAHEPGGTPVVADGHVFLVEAANGRDLDSPDYRISVHDLRTGRLLTAWEPGAMPITPAPDVGPGSGGRVVVPTSVLLAVMEVQ